MKRNGIILIATLIVMMFAGQVFGQDKFIVTASSPDASGGIISGGSPFSVEINMDNDAVVSPPASDWCGGNLSLKFYSPDASITEITHIDVSGPDLTYKSLEYLNGFETMMNLLIMPLVGTDLDGTLPDKIAFTVAGMSCMPAELELTAYIKFNLQIDNGATGTEGTFCIDSIDAVEGGNSEWDWLFQPDLQPTSFNGPYCWTVNNLNYSGIKQLNIDDATLPTEFMLEQNYPNPFNPRTQFNFALPRQSQVKIDIFNVLGQKIKTLADGEYEAGRYTIDWDGTDENGSATASGIYFYRMNADNFQDTKKLMLLK